MKLNFDLLIKILFLILIIFRIKLCRAMLKKLFRDYNNNCVNLYQRLNLTFYNIINNKKKLNIAVYTLRLKDGGRARITALLINYLVKINIFNLFLFTNYIIEENEYEIPNSIKRYTIENNLIKLINKNKIDILIYELDDVEEIIKLNNLKYLDIIFYQHSSIFDWIYDNFTKFKSIYKAFSKSKYIVSIVPFDSDYLFNKWGINSILMSNFMTFDFSSIFASDLSSKTILLIGRGDAKKKRFYIGIEAMEYIIKEIPNCELNIISSLERIDKIENLVNNLDLNNNINFKGYLSSLEIFFRNASLNFIPSISEAFPLVLSETKIYGIPSILLGLDYICNSKGGIIIIYDDQPETLARESIKIILNKEFRKKLGKESRNNMKQYNNELLLIKWVKLILSVNKGEFYYIKLRDENKKISKNNGFNILNNQLKLLKLRKGSFRDITVNEFSNFTYINNYYIN